MKDCKWFEENLMITGTLAERVNYHNEYDKMIEEETERTKRTDRPDDYLDYSVEDQYEI